MKRFDSVDSYVEGHSERSEELIKLREILNSTDLVEEVGWPVLHV